MRQLELKTVQSSRVEIRTGCVARVSPCQSFVAVLVLSSLGEHTMRLTKLKEGHYPVSDLVNLRNFLHNLRAPKDTRPRVEIRYEKYRFFIAETYHETIKRGLETSLTAGLEAGIQCSWERRTDPRVE